MRKISDNIIDKELDDFLYKYIKTFDSLYMGSDLTPTEMRYLIQLVKIHRQGIDITSSRANRTLRDFFNTKDKDRSIWIYRGKLKKKGWLIQTPDSIDLNPALKGKFDKVLWHVKMDYDTTGQN